MVFVRRVTLREVARRARVHTSTASRVLNPATRELITEPIARRVMTAAEQLGYQPNPNAYSLKTNRTRTVGHTVVAWSAITALTAAAWNYPVLLGVRSALGFGQAITEPSAGSLLADYYPHEERGRAFSIQHHRQPAEQLGTCELSGYRGRFVHRGRRFVLQWFTRRGSL